MSRRQKDPLRPLSDAERLSLSRLSRSRSAPAAQVARARAVLAVADGQSYAMAAELVGRATGDAVARWVAAFNRDGLVAAKPRHGGGHSVRYGEAEQRRILAEAGRVPERARDGTATWSLTTLRDALRRADDGLPGVSTYTIGRALHAAGYSWQRGRSWCETGVVVRRRKHEGPVTVADPDAGEKRSHAGGWRLGLVGRGRHRTAWRRPMPTDHPATTPQAAGRADDAKLFAALELSKSRWLVTVSAPGSEKLSKHAVSGGDGGALLDLLARPRAP